jgi:pimeloyl-ACP methyl ester carboxylesterase
LKSVPQIYCLAGLGFDKRIFYNLVLKNVEIKYLDWLEPENSESLEKYVQRIANQIDPTDSPIILLGHSFGGIIIQHISKLLDVEKVIIISSIKSSSEIPITLKFLKLTKLYNLFNQSLILKTFPIWARTFGYNSEKGRNLFVQMISNCSDNYFRWAMDKITHFEEVEGIENLIHIHGTNDKTFPISKIINPISIKDGSHFMVFSKAEEVSEVLNKLL